MKLLQINTVINTRSTGRIAEDIGRVMLNNGHESYVGFGREDRPSQSQLIKIGSEINVYSHVFQSFFLGKHGLASKSDTIKFLKQVDDIKPDVISIHNLHGYYLNYKVLFDYIKQREIPVVWTFHDCWPFTGHCSYFEKSQCKKWQTHCDDCPQLNHYPRTILDRSYKNFEDKKEAFLGVQKMTIVTPSNWLKGLVKQSFLRNYTVEVIHNGVDLDVFKPLNNVSKESLVLGVASQWDERKGLKDFLKLRELLSNEINITLIGLSKEQIRQLPEGIIGIERTEKIEDLVSWYNKASVFLNPTYIDNFPTTNIESLACGTPVVTYQTGGSPESINEKTGTVVRQGDVKGLKLAVEYWLSKDNTHDCRLRAIEYFNKEDRYLDYLNLYNNFFSENKTLE